MRLARGDKVRCVKNVVAYPQWNLEIGKVYIILSVERSGNLLLQGEKISHWPSRFEPVAEHIEGTSAGLALLSVGTKVNCIEPCSSQGGKFNLANNQWYVITKVHHGIGYELQGYGNTIFRAARFEAIKQKKSGKVYILPDHHFKVGDYVRHAIQADSDTYKLHLGAVYEVHWISEDKERIAVICDAGRHFASRRFELVSAKSNAMLLTKANVGMGMWQKGDWVICRRDADNAPHKLPVGLLFQIDEWNGSSRIYLKGFDAKDPAGNRIDYGAGRFEFIRREAPESQIAPKCAAAIRVGSTVRCLKGYKASRYSSKELIEGRAYTVRFICGNGNFKLDEEPRYAWTPDRFELVPPTPRNVKHFAVKEIPFGVETKPLTVAEHHANIVGMGVEIGQHDIDEILGIRSDRTIADEIKGFAFEPEPKPIDWFSPIPRKKDRVVHGHMPVGALKRWPKGMMEGAVLLNELRHEPSVQPPRSGALRHARRARHA